MKKIILAMFLVCFLFQYSTVWAEESKNPDLFYLKYHLIPGTEPGGSEFGSTLVIEDLNARFIKKEPYKEQIIDKTFMISKEVQKGLIDYIQQSDFFSLKGEYNEECYDGGVETLWIQIDKTKEKSVDTYFCGKARILDDIKNKIFEIINISQ